MAAESAKQVFRDFMALVIDFDRLQAIDGQALRKFQQELELFRRPPLDQQSEVLAAVFQNAPSPRLARYAEAGGHDSYGDRLNMIRYSAIRSLRNHREQARALIQALQDKVERATAIAKDDLDLYLNRAVTLKSACDSEDDALITKDRSSMQVASDYATLMALLLHMLQLDYAMQEKVIAALGLQTPSEPLESYCTMWTLRPFVDEGIFSQALKL